MTKSSKLVMNKVRMDVDWFHFYDCFFNRLDNSFYLNCRSLLWRFSFNPSFLIQKSIDIPFILFNLSIVITILNWSLFWILLHAFFSIQLHSWSFMLETILISYTVGSQSIYIHSHFVHNEFAWLCHWLSRN